MREKGHVDPYQGYDLPDIDEFSPDTYDSDNKDIFESYLGAEILLTDQDGNKKTAKVLKRVKGNNGDPVGKRHNNPIFDTSEYTVEIHDGSSKELTTNIIAESMLAQVDYGGHHYQLLKKITDHRKDRSEITV